MNETERKDLARLTKMSPMARMMRYSEADYRDDWNMVIALAQLMSYEETDARRRIFEAAWERIHAYQANNPSALPFEVQ